MSVRIDVVFDVEETGRYFAPTVDAVRHAASARSIELDLRVVRTNTIDSVAYLDSLPDGVVIGPGTPYHDPSAAEFVVQTARERGLPLVGT